MHDCGRFVRERQLGIAAMASTAFNQNLPRKVQHMARSCAEVTIFFQRWHASLPGCTVPACSSLGDRLWLLILVWFKAEQVGPSP